MLSSSCLTELTSNVSSLGASTAEPFGASLARGHWKSHLDDMAACDMAPNRGFLAPPAVSALRQEGVVTRVAMERTNSMDMDMREERQDLKEAAEQSLNVILDLGLDGNIRWVSPSWNDVVGTSAESVKNKPIADLLLSNNEGFANAVESMRKDDSKSHIIRFQVKLGELSVLHEHSVDNETLLDGANSEENMAPEANQELNLEGQGIMVYDRSSGGESHVRIHSCDTLLSCTDPGLDDVDVAAFESTPRNYHRSTGAARRISWLGSRDTGSLSDQSS